MEGDDPGGGRRGRLTPLQRLLQRDQKEGMQMRNVTAESDSINLKLHLTD